MTDLKKFTLPNGEDVFVINPEEAKFLSKEIYEDGTYSKHIDVRSPAPTFVDIGANIGLFALYMNGIYPDARFFCFEPGPQCLEAIAVNLDGLGDRCMIIGEAVSDEQGEAEFSYYPNYTIMSGLHADPDRDLDVLRRGAKTQFEMNHGVKADDRILDHLSRGKLDDPVEFKVQTNRLSNYIDAYEIEQIDLLKIDVERAEGQVIDGIDERHFDRILNIIAEVHDQGNSEQDMWAGFLRERGYRVVVEAEDDLTNSDIYALFAMKA